MRMLRVGWFIPKCRNLDDYNQVLASVWIRCLQMIAPFEANGIESVINQPRAAVDIAIFFRRQGLWTQWLQRRLRWRGVRTVFLVGVNYYEREGNLARIGHSVNDKQIAECIAMSRGADAVMTASHFLSTRVGSHNANVIYIPDTVSRSHFERSKSPADFDRTPLTLIWAGHSVKAHFIDPIYKTLSDLPVQLSVIAEKPPELASSFTFMRWRYETFPGDIVTGDIGIAPRVVDNSYDRGHSNFKIMVFLAQGVPVLVSPLDSYLEVVRDGYNGFICHRAQDWRHYVQKLVGDRALLRSMSRNAMESAKPYLTENIVGKYDVFFRNLVAGRRARTQP